MYTAHTPPLGAAAAAAAAAAGAAQQTAANRITQLQPLRMKEVRREYDKFPRVPTRKVNGRTASRVDRQKND